MRIDLVELFCSIHDFWMNFECQWNHILLSEGKRAPRRLPGLHQSEVMTIIILFHISGFRCFKNFYNGYVLPHLKSAFPKCPSYQRFVELKKSNAFPLYCYLLTLMGDVTGISFVDSTSIEVCHGKRIWKHKVFQGLAKRGKTSMGWFLVLNFI